MRKCLDCEASLPDVAMKCTECGSTNLSEIESAQDAPVSRKIKLSKPIIIAIACVLVLAVAATVGGFIFYRYQVTNPVISGVKSMYLGDFSGYSEQMCPALRDAVNEQFTASMSEEEYKSQQQQALVSVYGNSYTLNVTALDIQDCSKGILDSINSSYSEEYSVSFDDAKYVTVKLYIKGENGTETVNSRTVYSVKTDGKWYLFEDFAADSTDQNVQ